MLTNVHISVCIVCACGRAVENFLKEVRMFGARI